MTTPRQDMVGVLLAGGSGQRMRPLTARTNKHLIPVYTRPMIEYPLGTLLNMGVSQVCVVTGRSHMGQVVDLLGSGSGYGPGVEFTYRVQDESGGIAQALGLAEAFAAGRRLAVVLGDNVFDSDAVYAAADRFARAQDPGASVVLVPVDNPHAYGVATVEGDRIVKIEEKPGAPTSNLAVTGLYFYPPDLFEKIGAIAPSARGELEITDVNNLYVAQGRMTYDVIDRWFDAGEPDLWMRAQRHVEAHPARFGPDRFRYRANA